MSAEDIDVPPLETLRLRLEPLRVDHAEEMVPVLADERLYVFTGGMPPTLDELRDRYALQATGRSPDGMELWLNWIVRRREDGVPVGFVQAAISDDPPPTTAVLAWVLGVRFQGRGYAREAASALVDWLLTIGVARLLAYIHPEHAASMRVARGLGLAATEERVNTEVVWQRLTACE